VLHNLPGWTVTSKGCVAELDHAVHRHLLVLATHEKDRVYFLAAHLIDQTISMHAFRSERSLTVNLF
jgi:hypothetical protein